VTERYGNVYLRQFMVLNWTRIAWNGAALRKGRFFFCFPFAVSLSPNGESVLLMFYIFLSRAPKKIMVIILRRKRE
jgi:hypothetical protein